MWEGERPDLLASTSIHREHHVAERPAAKYVDVFEVCPSGAFRETRRGCARRSMGTWLLLAGFVRVILAQTGGAHQSRGIAEVLESPQLDPIFPPIPAVGQRHRIAHPLHRTSVPLKTSENFVLQKLKLIWPKVS